MKIYSLDVFLPLFGTSLLFLSSNCCFLTCIQFSQEVCHVVWYTHLFKNFPEFAVIHTIKGFDIVNKAEVNIFLELSRFFDDPWMLAIWSLVPLPFLNPAWTSGRCSASPFIREIQIKTTMRHHLTPLRRTIIEMSRINKYWRKHEQKRNFVHTVRNVNWCSRYRKQHGNSSKN